MGLNWKSKGYYVILGIISLIIFGLILLFHINNRFFEFYYYNFEQINTNFISIFGIIFGFLFTALAILFSLNDKSFFITLLTKNNRNKKDVIGYFALGISTSLLVVLISLFLTISYVGEKVAPLTNSTSFNTIYQNSCQMTKYPIFIMFYLGVFGILQFILLLITFVGLLTGDDGK
jgi:hypothetical protein